MRRRWSAALFVAVAGRGPRSRRPISRCRASASRTSAAGITLIERSPALVRQLPKESLFACQILSGRAYFIQRDRCLLADAGDVVVTTRACPICSDS